MVDDEEDNHSSRINPAYLEKVTYGAVVNFVSDGEICHIERAWNPWLLNEPSE